MADQTSTWNNIQLKGKHSPSSPITATPGNFTLRQLQMIVRKTWSQTQKSNLWSAEVFFGQRTITAVLSHCYAAISYGHRGLPVSIRHVVVYIENLAQCSFNIWLQMPVCPDVSGCGLDCMNQPGQSEESDRMSKEGQTDANTDWC